jgi:hypothetical protein
MYDIPELEKKWRKYKRKQRRKPIIIALTSILILVGGGVLVNTYLNNKNAKPDEKVAVNKTTQPQAKTETNNVKKEEPAIIIKKSTPNNSNPLINAKKETQEPGIDLSKAEIVKPNVPDDEIRVIGFDNKKEKQAIENKYSDILIPKKSTQDIKVREEIKDLEEQFKESQDPQDSLEIAKYYYKIKDYKKAETWAVNTNNLDGDLEESWLIFAKSRAKQGFRTDAIKVLQTFYDETNSQKAKSLLDKLRKGLPY